MTKIQDRNELILTEAARVFIKEDSAETLSQVVRAMWKMLRQHSGLLAHQAMITLPDGTRYRLQTRLDYITWTLSELSLAIWEEDSRLQHLIKEYKGLPAADDGHFDSVALNRLWIRAARQYLGEHTDTQVLEICRMAMDKQIVHSMGQDPIHGLLISDTNGENEFSILTQEWCESMTVEELHHILWRDVVVGSMPVEV